MNNKYLTNDWNFEQDVEIYRMWTNIKHCKGRTYKLSYSHRALKKLCDNWTYKKVLSVEIQIYFFLMIDDRTTN